MKKFLLILLILGLSGCSTGASDTTKKESSTSDAVDKTEEALDTNSKNKKEEKTISDKENKKDKDVITPQDKTTSQKTSSNKGENKEATVKPSNDSNKSNNTTSNNTTSSSNNSINNGNGQNASPQTPEYNITDVTGYAEELMASINNYRVQNGLPALQHHSGAQAFANKRAGEIMSNYSHSTQYDIRNETGLEPGGENIASGSSASGTFTMWKNSSGHNYTMLHSLAVYGAVGVKKDSVGRTFWVFVTLTDNPSEGGWE